MSPRRRLSALTFAWILASAAPSKVEPPPVLNDQPVCLETISLDSASDDGTSLGPWFIDEDGISICLQLDARRTRRSHLMAYTANESKATSSFNIVLYFADGQLPLEGWEVPMAGPTSSAHVEWGTDVPGIYDVVLRVAARPGHERTTTIHLAFFDPLE